MAVAVAGTSSATPPLRRASSTAAATECRSTTAPLADEEHVDERDRQLPPRGGCDGRGIRIGEPPPALAVRGEHERRGGGGQQLFGLGGGERLSRCGSEVAHVEPVERRARQHPVDRPHLRPVLARGHDERKHPPGGPDIGGRADPAPPDPSPPGCGTTPAAVGALDVAGGAAEAAEAGAAAGAAAAGAAARARSAADARRSAACGGGRGRRRPSGGGRRRSPRGGAAKSARTAATSAGSATRQSRCRTPASSVRSASGVRSATTRPASAAAGPGGPPWANTTGSRSAWVAARKARRSATTAATVASCGATTVDGASATAPTHPRVGGCGPGPASS